MLLKLIVHKLFFFWNSEWPGPQLLQLQKGTAQSEDAQGSVTKETSTNRAANTLQSGMYNRGTTMLSLVWSTSVRSQDT